MQNTGLESFWWFNVGILSLSLVMVILLFPETKWHRPYASAKIPEGTSPDTFSGEGASKSAKSQEENINGPDQTDLERSPTEAKDPWLGKGEPSRQQWKLFQPQPNALKCVALDIWIPWRMFAFPIVQFAALVVAWSCSVGLTVSLTQSLHFSLPPYNYGSQSIGFMGIAVLGGALLGLATAGPFSDWVSARATTKNGGIREPEMRLPAMIPFVLIMILANAFIAVGYTKDWSWPPTVILGYGLSGLQVAALPALASTYAVDSYK